MSEFETYKAAIKKYGAVNQILKLFEEVGEMQTAISQNTTKRLDNYGNIAEEIADVQILLEQMLILFDCRGLSAKFKREKLERLERMVSEA